MADLSTVLRFDMANGQKLLATLSDLIKNSGLRVSAVDSTAYVFSPKDNGDYLRFNNASPISATVPPDAVGFPLGAVITIEQMGAGLLTIAAGAGVTINTQTTLKMAGQWAVAALVKVSTDEWTLAGNLATS
jgi:hypothetical protein